MKLFFLKPMVKCLDPLFNYNRNLANPKLGMQSVLERFAKEPCKGKWGGRTIVDH